MPRPNPSEGGDTHYTYCIFATWPQGPGVWGVSKGVIEREVSKGL